MDDWGQILSFIAGVAISAIIGGWFAFLRGAPDREEVAKMISMIIDPMRKEVRDSCELSKHNADGIRDIQKSISDVNKDLALINKDFGYITKMVIDQKTIIQGLEAELNGARKKKRTTNEDV